MSLLGLKGLRKLVHGHQTGSEWISNEKKKGIRMNKKGRTKQLQLKYKARKQRKKPSKKRSKGMIREQGHPMDLFLKISVLQAHFCWLGDVEEIIVLGRKVLLGKR